jgi:hypothetical protein
VQFGAICFDRFAEHRQDDLTDVERRIALITEVDGHDEVSWELRGAFADNRSALFRHSIKR